MSAQYHPLTACQDRHPVVQFERVPEPTIDELYEKFQQVNDNFWKNVNDHLEEVKVVKP